MFKSLSRLAMTSAALCAMVLAGVAGVQAADDYPSRPIKLIVPWGAGGGMDNMSRILEPIFSKKLGQSFSFYYKPGASSALGTLELAQAKPDGYTLSVNNFPLQATNVALGIGNYKVDDLVPVCMVAHDSTMVAVLKDAPWKTMEEFVAAAKAAPDTISVAGPDRFGPSHGTALLLKKIGVPINVIPIAAGASKGNAALLGGQVQADTCTVSGLISIKDSIRVLMVCNRERISQFPDVPTSVELGMPEVMGFCGRFFWVPKGTPIEIINKLDEALREAALDPEVQKRLLEAGMEPHYLNHADAVKFIEEFQPVVDSLVESYKYAIEKGF